MTDEDSASPDDPHDAGRARIAKVIARAGLASRREAEAWIAAGRVEVNGQVISSPALNVGPRDKIIVDGVPLPGRERTRLWLYHKPRGLVTTAKDPEGRTTVFDVLPPELPRVVSVGRLDLNTEGLLLLTNDGGLARVLAHPSTAWLRRYRVRVFGKVDLLKLEALAKGIDVDGFSYGPIEASLDREQGDNAWLTLGLREGKNREVRKVLEHLGLSVNRLIRISFGPFQLGDLGTGAVEEIRTRYLRDQLGGLAEEADCDFDAPLVDRTPVPVKKALRARAEKSDGPRKRAGLTKDRKGRQVLVERFESEKPKRAEKPRRRTREDRPVRDMEAGNRADRRPRRDGDRPAFRKPEDRDGRREKRDEPRPYGNRTRTFRAKPDRPERKDRREPPRDRSSGPQRRDGGKPRGPGGPPRGRPGGGRSGGPRQPRR
jgi:23S rRNA pseudouridine2605 synthase